MAGPRVGAARQPVRDRDGAVGLRLRLREAPISWIERQTRDLLASGANRTLTLTPRRPGLPAGSSPPGSA